MPGLFKQFFTSKKDAPALTLNIENKSETTNSCKINIESEDKYCHESLKELRQKFESSYHSSVKHKFDKEYLEKDVYANLYILLISETKLDDSFPSAQFLLHEFSKPHRLNRCSNGGRILLYIRDDIPSLLLSNSNKSEGIFAEISSRGKNG